MNDSFRCSIAHTPEERARVYRLRYECYRRDGAIPPHPERSFSDAFDLTPNHFSFWVDKPAATVRISVVRPDLGWTDAPVRRVYQGHPKFEPIAAQSFVEASRLCFGPLARREAFVRLVAHMAAVAEFYGVGWLVACPRVAHAKVYERLFGFRPLAEPRRYFGVAFETQLLAIRRADLRLCVASDRRMIRAWDDALGRLRSVQPGSVMSATSGK